MTDAVLVHLNMVRPSLRASVLRIRSRPARTHLLKDLFDLSFDADAQPALRSRQLQRLATSLVHLGEIHLVHQRYDEAENLLRRALAIKEKAVTAQHPDLIMMDLAMPGMDGWEAARQLKADPETADIPIIALTAFALRGDEERAREAGCDDYLSKPCRPQTIREVVARFLAGG